MGSWFGLSVVSAGDLNGDGFADLVGGPRVSSDEGRAYVYHGGAGGLPTKPTATLVGPDGADGGFDLNRGRIDSDDPISAGCVFKTSVAELLGGTITRFSTVSSRSRSREP